MSVENILEKLHKEKDAEQVVIRSVRVEGTYSDGVKIKGRYSVSIGRLARPNGKPLCVQWEVFGDDDIDKAIAKALGDKNKIEEKVETTNSLDSFI